MKAQMKWMLALFVLSAVQGTAQMAPARKMTYDIDTTITFKVSVPILWEAIKDPAKWADISNGYIQSVTVSGEWPNQDRVVVFADGTQRQDRVTQYQPEYRFIVCRLIQPVIVASDDNLFTMLASTEGKGLSSCSIRVKVDGKGDEKRLLLEGLRKEVNAYAIGLTQYLKANAQ